MARSIWSGAISFGLVNVPVKLYSAVSRKTVRFHQLHEPDGVRIQQKRICPKDGEEVPYDQIVKGYELSPEHYVVITPEELESLDPKKTRTIDIQDFVDLDQIDPIYYDHPYYLVPDKGGAKAYKLLLEAMRESDRVAIARVVIRQKEHLTAIRPTGDILTMATMLFHDEVVPSDKIDDLPDAEIEAADREVAMARQLIESLSTDFEPEKYRDEYRERVLEMIERKAEGEEISVQPVEEPAARVPDLMAALEASVAAAKGKVSGETEPKADKPKPKKPKASTTAAKNGSGGGAKSRTGGSGGGKREKAKKDG